MAENHSAFLSSSSKETVILNRDTSYQGWSDSYIGGCSYKCWLQSHWSIKKHIERMFSLHICFCLPLSGQCCICSVRQQQWLLLICVFYTVNASGQGLSSLLGMTTFCIILSMKYINKNGGASRGFSCGVLSVSLTRLTSGSTKQGLTKAFKKNILLCSFLNVSAPLCIWTGNGIWEKRSHDYISFSLTFNSKNYKFFKDRDRDR